MGAIELRSPAVAVNTPGNTAGGVTWMIGPVEGSRVKTATPSLCFHDDSGNVEVAAVYATSNDRESWSAATAFSSYTSTAGWSYGSATDLSSAAKAWFKFGLAARNTTGIAVECARCQLITDITFD